MWESIFLTVLRAYALNKSWVIGLLMDLFGAALMLQALSQAPVSVIQPVSGCGLAILSVFSHFYLKERMNMIDWLGITLAAIGTIGVGAGGEEQKTSSISIFHLPWVAFIVAILFVGILSMYYLMDGFASTDVSEENRSWIASVISKMGFVFLEQGYSKLVVPACISISMCSSGTGFFYQTRGLKHGRAIVVSTCAAVASIVTGVLAGMVALGERLPSAPMARLSLLLGWVCILLGVVLLVTSTRLMRYLPRPLRRFMPGSVDRNPSLRRHGSLHATSRDSSPSAVIHATTLHHLLSSPSKEKP
ncbi:hypothetical protein RHMOL_Rhmol11G0096600 [Rhododendron molle]|uniref:Uncharacterized protein n=1 Tax=Rhododendron molle TaxID=49168 RepID=A0ACC0LQB4_RHOML|nr:hypothetical protein RHMOL_Rhmol11G0096600 [Rhododendron molle]